MNSKIGANYFSHAIVLIVGLFVGFLFEYAYTRSQLITLTRVASSQQEVLQSCKTAVDALNEQGGSCLDAYRILRSCITDKACNIETEEKKLQVLEAQRIEAETVLNQESERLRQIQQNMK